MNFNAVSKLLSYCNKEQGIFIQIGVTKFPYKSSLPYKRTCSDGTSLHVRQKASAAVMIYFRQFDLNIQLLNKLGL